MTRALGIVNPLPVALAHYKGSMQSTLRSAAVSTTEIESPSAELAELSALRKVERVAQLISSRKRFDSQQDLLVLWPAFGSVDALTWRSRQSVTLVWHDARPLRRTRLSGEFSDFVGTRGQRRTRVRVVTHSQKAADELTAVGFKVAAVLPHPTAPLRPAPRTKGRQILVAGQFKPTRDTALLEELGPLLRAAGLEPRIVGRGWPPIPGWLIDSRFVSESELDAAIVHADVVLLPYRRVYQSGVAVRAAELGRPVVGFTDSNVSEIFGASWRGLLSSRGAEDWLSAISDLFEADDAAIHTQLVKWRAGVISAWVEHAHDAGWGEAQERRF